MWNTCEKRHIHKTMAFDVAKFLPAFEEVSKLDPNDVEANYIFKFALKTLENKAILPENDYEEASYLVQSLVDRSWEQVNSGVFRDVPVATRRVYALACFLKIVFLLHDSVTESQLEECFRVLDSAMLVGCTNGIYGKADNFIEEISAFMNDKLGKTESTKLPLIEPIPYKFDCPCDIEKVESPSIEFFVKNYFDLLKPVLLLNTFNHWPARTKWRDPNYLFQVAGNRFVPIEIGSNYTTDDWSQEMIRFKEFLLRHFSSDASCQEVEYLAQHELFDQIAALKEDIRVPDYCCLGTEEPQQVDIKAWLGPKGTISPMHQDPKHNILCQVFGNKKIILASPDDTQFLYAHGTKMLENTSEINAEHLDIEKFPMTKHAKFYHLILQEGDAVYIPPKWWHYVRSLSKSFSVSFWWQ